MAQQNSNRKIWHAETVEATVKALGSDIHAGLSEEEARRRSAAYGLNKLLETQKVTWHEVFVRQFKSILILILFVAAAVSFMLGEIADTITILAIIILNGILGFIQEWKAERAMEALQRMLSLRCHVVRGGREKEIDAVTLVPGDMVLLSTGDRIPADVRLVEAINLKVDESVLTGESVSSYKDTKALDKNTPLAERRSMAWMGTAVTNGRSRGVVTATGMNTEFGRIAHLTQSVADETTPLQKKLAGLAKQLGIASLVIASLVTIIGVFMEKPPTEMFLIGVSLAVAVVPEGLPAVVTITLAIGIRAMVKRRALLRRLQAAESLGAATVICTDKTGTLTRNEMTVQRISLLSGEYNVTGVGYDPTGHFERYGEKISIENNKDLSALLETGLKCNNAKLTKDEQGWREIGEPTEAALVVVAYKAHIKHEEKVRAVSEFSFNSSRKRMTVIERSPNGMMAHVKGAPEVIIERCSRVLENGTERALTSIERETFTSTYNDMADSGLRTLALARRTLPDDCALREDIVETNLTLLGVVGIIDPPRPEAKNAIKLGNLAGIRIIMITGDAAGTAMAIAKRIGLKIGRVITGSDVSSMDDQTLDSALDEDPIFARTTPEHKLRIVTRLKLAGHVVGMTGDGVNDAPALKKADVGIAMGIRGTDVAKGASDMVLTDDNFASIIGAIEEGRRQYDNIQKFVRYLLSSNVGEVVAILTNIMLGGPLILLPVQILWMNLVTDGMTAVALGLEPKEKDVMKRPPHSPAEPIINKAGILTVLAIGTYIGMATLWLFQHTLSQGGDNATLHAQTVAFTGIIILEKINVFNFRSLKSPLREIGFFTNPWVLLAWTVTVGFQVGVVYIPFFQEAFHTMPLPLDDWALIFVVAMPVFLIVETYKWYLWREQR